jgi:hypothetical protein
MLGLPLRLPIAHALVGKSDLPIPAWLFAWGASMVLIISFVGLSIAWRSPRLERDGWRPILPGVSAVVLSRPAEAVAEAIGILLLGVTIWSGLAGTSDPTANFSLTFVYVTAWLGIAALSILLGDIFRPFNPWRTVARAAGAAFRALARADAPAPPFAYPQRLGRWPAVAGLIAFVWLELIYAGGLANGALEPRVVAEAALAYTGITLLAMSLFGAETWLDRGETFGVYFGMLARLSIVEARDRRLGIRKPLSGTVGWAEVPGSVALALASIGGTSFDGAQEGALKSPIDHTFNWFLDRGLSITWAYRVTDTIFLAGVLLGVAAVFWIGVWGMSAAGGGHSPAQLRRSFAHSLIPIAFAYLVAHYFSLVVFQEQAQFTYLLSDPLGHGWNLFGTGTSGIDYALIGVTAVWYVQVAALVVGHVGGLTLAHDRALVTWKDLRTATRSQYWMLTVMISFTCFGLYLLSQANR